MTRKEFIDIITTEKSIDNPTDCEHFSFEEGKFDFVGIQFTEYISVPQAKYPLSFFECEFAGIAFRKATYSTLQFDHCTFKGNIEFNNLTIDEFVDVEDCKIDAAFTIDGGDYKEFKIMSDVKSMHIKKW